MRFTELVTKTKKEAPKDEVSKNAELLIRAGYIHKEMAGVYAYLPLGLRVIERIKTIVREEMNKLGSQEMIMTSLQRKELWEETDRWDDKNVDVWFKSKLKNGKEVGFGWSHEEPITNMLKEHIHSYRDLPVYVYQFQNKLRNELRAKSGILRGREFLMKDLYSYSVDEAAHEAFYAAAIEAYLAVFKRVGLGDRTFLTFASGGAFTQFSHEFQTVSEAGEDTIYLDRKKSIAVNKEVLTKEVLTQLNLKKEELEEVAAIETGNIFSFGDIKSKELGLTFTDENGKESYVILGSYGIGITRLMGTVVEVLSDDKGIIWPDSITPYNAHIVTIGDEPEREQSKKIYNELAKAGLETLWDDRNESPGAKLKDSDLMGVPVRIVISKKSGTQCEVTERQTGKTTMMKSKELIKHLQRRYV